MLPAATALFFTFNLFHLTTPLKQCQTDKPINFHKIKSCHKSTSAVTFSKKVSSLEHCKSLTKETKGLAFNFSPADASNYTKSFLPNCQVLGCPDTTNSTTLKMDLAYDYYSAYGNYNATENATCVSSVGLFSLTNNYQNYSQSVIQCQNISGDLADVSSEYRTMFLSEIVNNSMQDWYKAVFVGLDDIGKTGVFKNVDGKLLTCSSFRSWAPGHPRLNHKRDNCVILDSDRLWRTVNCHKVKLRGLCELHPQAPPVGESFSKNFTCDYISDRNKKTKKNCLKQKQLFDVFHNSSRLERCAMLNYDNKTQT